jgi:outer membrane protein
MKRNFKFIISLCFAFSAFLPAFSQQITKFGLVDTSRIYQLYFRNSAPVRNYEEKKQKYQDEINQKTEELKALQQKKADYQNAGNETAALKTEAEIIKQKDYLTEYTNAKNIELESLKKSLQNSDEFYTKLQATLKKVAESGGYSMILSLQDDLSILWYSSSIDITNQVINELGLN